jgi:hypothetical protein
MSCFADRYRKQGIVLSFTCKDTMHQWLKETVDNSEVQELRHREWNGRYHVVYTCR